MKESVKDLERFEEYMKNAINSIYGDLVKTINDCLEAILRSTVTNAENLENLFGNHIDLLKTQRMKEDGDFVNTPFKNLELVSFDKFSTKSETTRDKSSPLTDQNFIVRQYSKTEVDDPDVKEKEKYLLKDNWNEKQIRLKSAASTLKLEQEKRFECNQCVYKTNDSSNLTRHVKAKHSMVKDWSCTECEFVASRKFTLMVHLKSKHRNL